MYIPNNIDMVTVAGRNFALPPGVKADRNSYTRAIFDSDAYMGFITVYPNKQVKFYSPRIVTPTTHHSARRG
jgi:hypothetical protein